MGKLSGKTALVTGAGQGIGLGIARQFAIEGADLVITGRDEAKLKGVVPELEALGAKVVVCAGDGSVRANAEKAVQAAVDAFGKLDVLVNNAQTSAAIGKVDTLSEERIRVTIESGFYATLWHMLAALPHLKKTQGSVINTGSPMAVTGGVDVAVYAAGKEAIRGLSRSLAREWGPHGIRVNTINPTALSTAAVAYFKANPEREGEGLKQIALARFGDPQADIGPPMVFLASDDSRYVTGQTINVDGGVAML